VGCSHQLLPVHTVPAWHGITGLEHGFFTRHGGVSAGNFAELNLSSKVGDEPAAVAENWARIRSHLGDRLELVTMNQVHGAHVAFVSSPVAAPEQADAMVSNVPRVGLGVLTADCVPILLVAPRSRLVAAVHAGWRGTVAGVVVAAVRQMLQSSDTRPAEVCAALGPAIGPCCYEVDESIVHALEAKWGAMPTAVRRYIRDGEPKARLDLRSANRRLLIDAGLEADSITRIGGCTSCGPSEFFSYRAATIAGRVTTGRQLSYIGWCA